MAAERTPWYRTQIVTLVLLAIVAVIVIWAAVAGQIAAGQPAIGVGRGILLLVVGFFAGLLGGLIGTGGCSVMLPIIHFWMGFPASLAVGTTLFAVIFTAISGAWGHLVRRNLDRRATLWLGGGGVLGVLLGS
ncbi:MAG: TSUP family transporter, partial [Anaerolineae bacterium]